jgi:elongation factor Tu
VLGLLAVLPSLVPARASAPAAEPFFMPIADVFGISGIGTVAIGMVERGTVKAGDRLELIGPGAPMAGPVSLLAPSGGPLQSGQAGQEIGVIVRGIDGNAVTRGMALVQPGSLRARKSLTAEVTLAATGGRTTPINSGYRPLLRIWTDVVSGTFTFTGPLAPAGKATVEVELERPSPLRIGDSFAVTEGGRTIGAGVVTAVKG